MFVRVLSSMIWRLMIRQLSRNKDSKWPLPSANTSVALSGAPFLKPRGHIGCDECQTPQSSSLT